MLTNLIVLASTFVGVPQQPGGEDMASITAAWKVRGEEIRSFRVEWEDDEFQPKGAMTSLKSEPIMPPKDTVFHLRGSLAVAGEKIADSHTDYVWSSFTGQCDPSTNRSVFRDRVGKALVRRDGEEYPTGTLNDAPKNTTNLHFLPFFMAFRPALRFAGVYDPETAYIRSSYLRDGERVVVVRTSDHGGYAEDVHLIPSDKFKIIKYESFSRGRQILKMNIQYHPNSEYHWQPSSWTTSWWSPQGKLMWSCSVRVTRCEINIPINEEEFELDFPAGTLVTDIPKQTMFLALDRDRTRPISRDDFAKGLAIRAMLEEDRAASSGRSFALRTTVMLAVAFGTLAVVFAVRARLRRREPDGA